MSSSVLLRSVSLLLKRSQSVSTIHYMACAPVGPQIMKLVQHNDVVKYQFREYAKGKDKKKSDKGRQQKVEIKEDLIAEVVNFQKMKGEMDRALEQMKEDYVKNLSLRSSAGSIESLKVNFEGKKFELIEVAQVFRQNPKTISINMSAFPQMIPPVLKSISSSGMNLNPQQDGTMIYIPVPKVTREHRETLAKNAKTLFIKCRDSVKDVQNKILKTIKNKEKNGLSVDVGRDISEQIIFIANQYTSEAEKVMEAKCAELLKEAL